MVKTSKNREKSKKSKNSEKKQCFVRILTLHDKIQLNSIILKEIDSKLVSKKRQNLEKTEIFNFLGIFFRRFLHIDPRKFCIGVWIKLCFIPAVFSRHHSFCLTFVSKFSIIASISYELPNLRYLENEPGHWRASKMRRLFLFFFLSSLKYAKK